MDNVFGDFIESPREKLTATLKKALAEGECRLAKRILTHLKTPFRGGLAGEVLLGALKGKGNLFFTALDACAPGEYGGMLELEDSRPGRENTAVTIGGTFLTLAAALGRIDLVEGLLRRGWDVNAAGLAAQNAMCHIHHFFDFFLWHRQRDGGDILGKGAYRGRIFAMSGKLEETKRLEGVTPLAAALYFEREEVVTRLLEEQGVWVGECGAVSVLYLTCCKKPKTAVWCRLGKLLRGKNADPKNPILDGMWGTALLSGGGGALLEQYYRTPTLTVQMGIAVLHYLAYDARSFDPDPWDSEQRQLLRTEDSRSFALTLRRFPELWAQGWVKTQMAESCIAPGMDFQDGMVFRLYRKHCGADLDLTPALPNLLPLPVREQKALLDQLRQAGFRLLLSADARLRDLGAGGVAALLRRVTLIPSSLEEGLPGVVCHILDSGSLQLVRKQLGEGVLREESRSEMMAYLKERHSQSPLRPLLLMDGQKKEALYVL